MKSVTLNVVRGGLVTSMLVLWALPAASGNLSKTVHGIRQQTGQAESRPQSDTSEDDSGGPSESGLEDFGAGSGGRHSDPGGVYQPYVAGQGASVEVIIGGQSVFESNGAVHLSARASYKNFAVLGGATTYFEEAGPRTLTFSVWDLGIAYGGFENSTGPVELWVEGGVAGGNGDEVAIIGGFLGVRAAWVASSYGGVEVGARSLFFQDSVRAALASAEVVVSVFRVGYRYLDFNVGPPLQGPTAALALSF